MVAKRKKVSTRRCGLCGKTRNLMKTECCGNWICNDHHEYKLFSYSRNSCARNHSRMTLCAFHFNEEHEGDWKECRICRESFEPEMVVWYGTNEYNFEKLPDPPAYHPTRCNKCGGVIVLSTDGYTYDSDGYTCEECFSRKEDTRPEVRRRRPRS